MSATYSGNVAGIWADGDTVGAYPESNWLQSELPPSGAPKGAADATGVVGTGGALTINGLTEGKRYFLAKNTAGTRYLLHKAQGQPERRNPRFGSFADQQLATWDVASQSFVGSTPSAGGVTSVAGRTGAVVLAAADVSGASHLFDTYANRPAASSALNGCRFFATDKLMEWQCIAAAWVLVNAYAPFVTSLPSSPIDGQECVLQLDAANGVSVQLRYNGSSASAYKWEAQGGSDLFARVATAEATSSQTFVALTTAGPSITVPFAGDWIVEVGALFLNDTAGDYAVMSYDIGATGAVDDDGITMREPTGSAGVRINSSQPTKKTLAASTALVSKYRRDVGGTASFIDRWMRVKAVRLG